MIDERYIELMNHELDGVNSIKKKEELRGFLATHHEAHLLYEDLLYISDTLSKVEEVEPPINLKKSVLNSIQPAFDSHVRQFSSLTLFELFRLPKFTYAFASTLVIGAVLGIAAYSLFIDKDDAVDPSSMYGTMASRSSNLQSGDRFEIIAPGIEGVAGIRYSSKILLSEVTFNSQNETDFVLEFPEKLLSFSSFSQSTQGTDDLKITTHSIAGHIQGRQGYVLVFKRKDVSQVSLNLKVFRSGSTVFEKSLIAGTNELPE